MASLVYLNPVCFNQTVIKPNTARDFSCQKALLVYLNGRRPQDVLWGCYCSERVAIAKKKKKTQEGTKQKKPWMAINELHMLKASVVQEGKKDGTHLHASVEEDDEDTEQSHTCLYRILHGCMVRFFSFFFYHFWNTLFVYQNLSTLVFVRLIFRTRRWH